MSRCPWSIRYGTSAETSTRCDKDTVGHEITAGRDGPQWFHGQDPEHSGPGLPQNPGQRIIWQAGDRREYTGDWPGYCTALPGAPYGGGCCLPAGHHGRHAP